MGARRQQGAHHRAPQGAGAAGYHHVTLAKIHPTLLFLGLDPATLAAPLLVLALQLEAQLAALHGDELHLGGHPHAHGRRCHMAEIDMGTHGLLPLLGKRLQASKHVASTKATMHAAASTGGMSESGPSRAAARAR